MYIYNVTTKIDWDIHEKWMEWLKDHYIPSILDYGCFTKATLLKLQEIDESDGPTYAIQFYAISKADYNRYIELYAYEILTIEKNYWNNKMTTFGTLMQIME